jgi:WD40 repeat protein
VESIRGRASGGAISADSTRLAIGTTGGQGVLMWNTKSWNREPSPVTQVPDYVDAVALSHDGNWLAFTTSKPSKEVEWVLWNVASQKESQRHVVPGSGMIRAIEFVPDDELLFATGGNDGVVRHWRGTQAEPVSRTFHVGQPICAVASRPAGHLLAIGAGKRFALWDSERNVRTFVKDQLPVQVDDVAFTPNGQHACVAAGAFVEIFDADTGRAVDTLTGFGARVLSMAHTPDGAALYAVSANGKLTLWRVAR